MGIVTRKRNDFETIKAKPDAEVTSDDQIVVETLIESLEDKVKTLDQIKLETFK